MEKCIIVAIADNNAIGKDNALLWHISEDLKFFKRTTTGSPVIMGRKTFESIGRPLPKRTNIVISRGFTAPEGVIVVPSLSEAYNAVIQDLSCHSESASSCHSESASSCHSEPVEESPSRCFIIGGGQIYAQAIADADHLIVTHVHTVIEDADTFFPEIDPSFWQVEERSEMLHDDESGFDFEFVTYKRREE
ncbi:MAG: dihydrofolate reductase [Bacteroidales bacterium]|nr:dihydrofolate reductase [Bacteroidales bacterium]